MLTTRRFFIKRRVVCVVRKYYSFSRKKLSRTYYSPKKIRSVLCDWGGLIYYMPSILYTRRKTQTESYTHSNPVRIGEAGRKSGGVSESRTKKSAVRKAETKPAVRSQIKKVGGFESREKSVGSTPDEKRRRSRTKIRK